MQGGEKMDKLTRKELQKLMEKTERLAMYSAEGSSGKRALERLYDAANAVDALMARGGKDGF